MILNIDMMVKRGLGTDVLTAARQRISWCFDRATKICVGFSGGKDSTCLLHLAAEEARRRQVRISALFIDWEAQYQLTIEHVRECLTMYADCVDPIWSTVPLKTTNACSQFEPEWICWERGKEDCWVRPLPPESRAEFPFYYYPMTFEEFVPAFANWFGDGHKTAMLIGIRVQESLNRWRTLASDTKECVDGKKWTTQLTPSVFNAYPIYDWAVEDDWTFLRGKPYNRVYDRMYQAGLTLHQMRICEPYGDEQRRGLWLYHVLEPETWGRVVARVAGANTGALYSRERGNISGNGIEKPLGQTWESYAKRLLDSMPTPTAEHYRGKVAVWLRWYQSHGGFTDGKIHDELDGDLGGDDMPSWRRVCKMLLKNDYWAKTLAFSPTKSSAYHKYASLMKRRRESWGLI